MSEPYLVHAEGLVKHHRQSRGLLARISRTSSIVPAVDGVTLGLRRGETLGLIGESGCGKSTLGRTLLMLHRPDAGRITFAGLDLTKADARALLAVRRRMQMVFQDPYSSLNPVRTVEQIIGLPLLVHEQQRSQGERRDRVAAMMEKVGLQPAHMSRYPRQFSGGQRQRIGIARALILEPDFVVCDEPVSALDVSVQAQIVELLQTLKRTLRLTYLFISHDLSVVAYVSDWIAVMYGGEIVEYAPSETLIRAPSHPYTQLLWSAIPRIGTGRGKPVAPMSTAPSAERGEVANVGCRFVGRCSRAMDICRQERPSLRPLGGGQQVACHLYPQSLVVTQLHDRAEGSSPSAN